MDLIILDGANGDVRVDITKQGNIQIESAFYLYHVLLAEFAAPYIPYDGNRAVHGINVQVMV
jgi:hypothetical protein